MEALETAGRAGHPALTYLKSLANGEIGPLTPVDIAAIAFEAGCRMRYGALCSGLVAATGTAPLIEPFLRERPANDWEPAREQPYREVDWRAAITAAGEDFADGAFEIEMQIPGAAVLAALACTTGGRRAAVRAVLGSEPRDDVLDYVAATGAFLAQALPDFCDLDVALREFRLRQASSDAGSASRHG
ncbi:MAG: hypothetical protein AAF646_03360 [Pseudomonadota bacterium]